MQCSTFARGFPASMCWTMRSSSWAVHSVRLRTRFPILRPLADTSSPCYSSMSCSWTNRKFRGWGFGELLSRMGPTVFCTCSHRECFAAKRSTDILEEVAKLIELCFPVTALHDVVAAHWRLVEGLPNNHGLKRAAILELVEGNNNPTFGGKNHGFPQISPYA